MSGFTPAGPVWRGFANSEGQRNWHETTTFNLEWSLYFRTDKAVKSRHAGFAWDGSRCLPAKMSDARDATFVDQPTGQSARSPENTARTWRRRQIEEIASLLCWGGFSGRALATQQSALARMQTGETLDARVSLVEDTASGVAPAFQAEGFARPDGSES